MKWLFAFENSKNIRQVLSGNSPYGVVLILTDCLLGFQSRSFLIGVLYTPCDEDLGYFAVAINSMLSKISNYRLILVFRLIYCRVDSIALKKVQK